MGSWNTNLVSVVTHLCVMGEQEECSPLLGGQDRPSKDCHFVFLLSLSVLVVFSFSWYCYFVDQRQSIIKLFLPIFLWVSCLILVVFMCKARKTVNSRDGCLI